ncbi:hypothetical protein VTJ49DRAFT_856 [Mycothermus thermophilus]|uniref:Uncharacterized protein n=1 Tax=Humicola insolens TaxID=85995 RepID=A0ABR3VQY7_HUMIN
MGRVCKRLQRRVGEDEMILLVVEVEAMARLLSERGKNWRRRGMSEKEEQVGSWGSGTSGWSGQRAQRAAIGDLSGQFDSWLGKLSTWSSQWVRSGSLDEEREERENFDAALWEMVGQSRTQQLEGRDGRWIEGRPASTGTASAQQHRTSSRQHSCIGSGHNGDGAVFDPEAITVPFSGYLELRSLGIWSTNGASGD